MLHKNTTTLDQGDFYVYHTTLLYRMSQGVNYTCQIVLCSTTKHTLLYPSQNTGWYHLNYIKFLMAMF